PQGPGELGADDQIGITIAVHVARAHGTTEVVEVEFAVRNQIGDRIQPRTTEIDVDSARLLAISRVAKCTDPEDGPATAIALRGGWDRWPELEPETGSDHQVGYAVRRRAAEENVDARDRAAVAGGARDHVRKTVSIEVAPARERDSHAGAGVSDRGEKHLIPDRRPSRP